MSIKPPTLGEEARNRAEKLEQFQDASLTCVDGPEDLGRRPFRKVMDFVGRNLGRPVRRLAAFPATIIRGAADPLIPRTKVQQATLGVMLCATLFAGAKVASDINGEMKARNLEGAQAAIGVFQKQYGGMPEVIQERMAKRMETRSVASAQEPQTDKVAFASQTEMSASDVTAEDILANAELAKAAGAKLAHETDVSTDVEALLAQISQDVILESVPRPQERPKLP